MNAFSFRPAPTYRAASPDEQMTAAFDMPMSLLSTLGQQAKGGILDSFGLGTAVRTVTTPETAPVESGSGIADTLGAINRAIAPENMIRRAIGNGYRDSPVLDEDKYKSSAYYRDGVKWDPGMTEDRAAALAESFDAKRVRDHFASKRPITAFLGNIAGQALDPINYIPIMGQTVKAANVARFGRVGGAAITNAIDAAANTALAGALTYSARKDFGDDITWQSTVSEIAMSALIGGAFGGVSGVLDSRRAARAANATALASEALSTLKNVQDARIALNSAIDGLVRGEDVNLSANAADAVKRINDELLVYHGSPHAFDRFDLQKIGTGEGAQSYGYGLYFADNPAVAESYKADLAQTVTVDGNVILENNKKVGTTGDANLDDMLIAHNGDLSAAIDEVQSYVDKSKDGGARIGYDKLLEKLRSIEGKVETSNTGNVYSAALRAAKDEFFEWEKSLSEQSKAVQDAVNRVGRDPTISPLDRIADDMKGIELKRLFDNPKAARELTKLGMKGVRFLDQMSRSAGDGTYNYVVFSDDIIELRQRNGVDLSPAKPDATPMGRAEAEARVAAPENYKAASEQYGVNPDDGTFIEQTDVDRLRNDGRLTPDDEAALVDAEATYENGVSYGEALKAVVGCLLA